jgi:hypothetical protein
MHRNIDFAEKKAPPGKALSRLVVCLLLWIACFLAAWGCGKEPPVIKTEPMRKNRIPTRVTPGRNP